MIDSNVKFCDGVRHLYIPGLNSISGYINGGLRQWLASSDHFLPRAYAKDDLLEVTFYDATEVLSVWARDIDRLSCAAIETIVNITVSSKNKKFIAWNLVNYYYAAFYSAHSLLKILGFGLIQIDDSIIRSIKQKCIALGINEPHITNGMYCIQFDFMDSCMRFYKVNRYNESHKGLWQRFSDFLSILIGVSVESGNYDSTCIKIREPSEPHPQSLYTYLPSQDAERIISRLEELKSILNVRGNHNWLSTVRNIVNYNHGFGVWYPYKLYNKQYDKVLDMANLCFNNPLNNIFDAAAESDLVIFTKYCQLINALNIEVLYDLQGRHPENKSFLRNGVMAYIKHYNVS